MPEGWQDFHFLRPLWLLGAVPALLLALLWVRRHWRNSPWREALAPELLAVLLEPQPKARKRLAPWALAAALLAGAVSLAGPTWQRLPQPVEQQRDALVILFDLSLSLYAEDLAPSRLARATHKIADVLHRRQEGFTALVAYAGDSHVVAPLTDDVRTIENLLTALSPAMMPVLGSNPGSALELAHELFDNAGLEQGRLLLVTDGVDAVSGLASGCRRSFPVAVLGVGTAAAAPIPLDAMDRPGQHLADRQGALVRAPLDAERLAAVADLCRGRYQSIKVDDEDIAWLLATPLPSTQETAATDRLFDAWADLGHWGAAALLPLLLFGFRKGFLACLPLCVWLGLAAGLLPAPAAAGLWEDLWSRRDQQGYEALQEGQPESAASLFADPAWRNAAKYRSEDYQGAAEGWRQADGATDLYNLGNALARLGDYPSAIAAYEGALAAAPTHEDAAFNKALVEQLLQQQQQEAQQNSGEDSEEQQEQSEGRGQNAQDGDPRQDQGGQEDQAQQQQANSAPEGQPEDDGEAERAAQSEPQQDADSHDEQAQALEQWLRRVPDDPGGLLRRKFQHETNQRRRRGDYRDRQQEKIW